MTVTRGSFRAEGSHSSSLSAAAVEPHFSSRHEESEATNRSESGRTAIAGSSRGRLRCRRLVAPGRAERRGRVRTSIDPRGSVQPPAQRTRIMEMSRSGARDEIAVGSSGNHEICSVSVHISSNRIDPSPTDSPATPAGRRLLRSASVHPGTAMRLPDRTVMGARQIDSRPCSREPDRRAEGPR